MCSLHDEQPNARVADVPASSNLRLLAYLRTRLQSAIGPTITIGCDTMRLALDALEEQDASHPIGASGWPEAVSDGLATPCSDCGQLPRFDYRVDSKFWRRHVPGPERTSVICLPCLDLRCGGAGLAEAIIEVQWTGTKHTVVLRPTLRHVYEAPTERPTATDDATDAASCCHDCGREYGDGGFPDLIIPYAAWKEISPTGDDGGLLCPSCICARLAAKGITGVEGAFMCGPIDSVPRSVMYALRRVEDIELAIEGRNNALSRVRALIGNPMDTIEPMLRQVAAETGLHVDEASLAAARAYCEEPVQSDTFGGSYIGLERGKVDDQPPCDTEPA